MKLKLFENFLWEFSKSSIKDILQDIIDDYGCEILLTESNTIFDLANHSTDSVFRRAINKSNPRFIRIDILCYLESKYSIPINKRSALHQIEKKNMIEVDKLDIIRTEMIEKLEDCDFNVKDNPSEYTVDEYGTSPIHGILAGKTTCYIIISKN